MQQQETSNDATTPFQRAEPSKSRTLSEEYKRIFDGQSTTHSNSTGLEEGRNDDSRVSEEFSEGVNKEKTPLRMAGELKFMVGQFDETQFELGFKFYPELKDGEPQNVAQILMVEAINFVRRFVENSLKEEQSAVQLLSNFELLSMQNGFKVHEAKKLNL